MRIYRIIQTFLAVAVFLLVATWFICHIIIGNIDSFLGWLVAAGFVMLAFVLAYISYVDEE